ncbi:MAG: sulfatase-like hydrolase/transferase [Opitutales bacterium]
MKTFTPCVRKAVFVAASLCASVLISQTRPNIVLLYMDDWAWNGTPLRMNDEMPNSAMPVVDMPYLERLADEGMKFTNAYGSQQCAPARVSVQTGKTTARHGFTVVLGKIRDDYYDTRPQYQKFPMVPNVAATSLDTEAMTIPKALAPLGYQSAHLGKWHMYCDPSEAGYVLHDGETTNKEGNTLVRDEKGRNPARLPVDMTDPKLMFSMTEKAIGFMEEQAQQGNPFFVQISHYAMHEGRETLDDTRRKYAEHPLVKKYYEKQGKTGDTIKRGDDPATWLGMAEDMDSQIGAVLTALDRLKIADNTYVIVVSDNGYRHKTLALDENLKQPLHSHKWWAWQGGIRVPMIVKGPGIQGGSKFEANVINYDFLPTFLEWAGGDPSTLKDIDGVSLAPYMAGKQPSPEFVNRPLILHVPHYRESVPHSAVIAGNAKVMHFYERPDIPMLFDLARDPGEVFNIARQHPEVHMQLFEKMMTYLNDVGAKFPKPNPDYDPEVYKNGKSYKKQILWGPFEGQRPLEEDEI